MWLMNPSHLSLNDRLLHGSRTYWWSMLRYFGHSLLWIWIGYYRNRHQTHGIPSPCSRSSMITWGRMTIWRMGASISICVIHLHHLWCAMWTSWSPPLLNPSTKDSKRNAGRVKGKSPRTACFGVVNLLAHHLFAVVSLSLWWWWKKAAPILTLKVIPPSATAVQHQKIFFGSWTHCNPSSGTCTGLMPSSVSISSRGWNWWPAIWLSPAFSAPRVPFSNGSRRVWPSSLQTISCHRKCAPWWMWFSTQRISPSNCAPSTELMWWVEGTCWTCTHIPSSLLWHSIGYNFLWIFAHFCIISRKLLLILWGKGALLYLGRFTITL